MSEKAVMMRASDGYWFQVTDETGRRRVSFLGALPGSLAEVVRWCEAHDIEFVSFGAKRSAARAARAQMQGREAFGPANWHDRAAAAATA